MNKLNKFYEEGNLKRQHKFKEARFIDAVQYIAHSLFDKRDYVKTHVEYIDEESGEIIDICIADRYPTYKLIPNQKTIKLAKSYIPTTRSILDHSLKFLNQEIDLVCHSPTFVLCQNIPCIMQFDLNKLKRLVKHLGINYDSIKIKSEKKEIFKRFLIRDTTIEYYNFVNHIVDSYTSLNADCIDVNILTEGDYEIDYREQQWERWKSKNMINSAAKFSLKSHHRLKSNTKKKFIYSKKTSVRKEFTKEHIKITEGQYDKNILGSPRTGIQTRMYFGLISQNRILRNRIMVNNNMIESDLKAAHVAIAFSLATGYMSFEKLKNIYSWMNRINPRLYKKQINHLEKYIDVDALKTLLTSEEIVKISDLFINSDFRDAIGLSKIETLISLFYKNHQVKKYSNLRLLEDKLTKINLGRLFLSVLNILKQYDDKDHSHFSTTCLIIEQIIIQTMVYKGQQLGISIIPLHDAIAFNKTNKLDTAEIYNTVIKGVGLLNPTITHLRHTREPAVEQ